MKTSFLVCGHNSRTDLTCRVIQACLDQQDLGVEDEILLVDSGSTPPLAVPAGMEERVRLVRVDQPGLARARVRGIEASRGEMVIFVDDDTVLATNYLKEARQILGERPYLGAIGGQLLPEYEGPLPLPERFYRERLAIREFSGEHWSNRWDDFATSPIGGGMVVRRECADAWAELCGRTSWRLSLGRSGDNLSGGEDIDLLRAVCQAGYGKGIFSSLKLTHIFPPHRLTAEFLLRITEGNRRSGVVLRGMFDPSKQPPPDTWASRLKIFLEGLRKPWLDRRLWYVEDRGRRLGWRQVAQSRKRHHRYKAPASWPLSFRLWRSFITRIHQFTWAKMPYNSWGDRIANTVKFIEQHNRWPQNRLLFNDVFFRIKLNAVDDPFKKRITDKLELKSFVRDHLGDNYNVPTLAVLTTEAEVRAYQYPHRCCIKPAHSSGQVIIRKQGEKLDLDSISEWLRENYYYKSREANYRDLPPAVIVEPLVFDNENAKDYKFFCYFGAPKLIQVDIDRHSSHKRALYSTNWVKQPFGLEEVLYSKEIDRPQNLSAMLDVARKLSAFSDLVRVDLYTNGYQVCVGEVTIVHGSAGQIFDPLDGERMASEIIFGSA